MLAYGAAPAAGRSRTFTDAERLLRFASVPGVNASPVPERSQHDRRWLILAIIGIAQLMVVLDATIVNIALPSAQKSLGFTNDNRQWVVTAYALAFGSLLLLGGRIGDLFGRKWTFIVGLVGFAIASALGGAAQSFGMLVAARALQGAFGALLAPSALGLLTSTFTEPRERGRAFGVFGAIAGSGAALGLLLGGILTEWLSWRWCLYVNLIFAAVAVIGALALIVNPVVQNRPKLDFPGTLAASGGLFCLVYGFSHAETTSWTNGLTLAALGAAVVLLVGFVLIERAVAHPLLPLRVILDRNRGGSYLAVGISGIAIFGVFLFLTYFLQQNLAFSPIQCGLAFLPLSAAIITMSTTSSTKLLPRFGPRPLVVLGMLLGALGMALLTGLDATSSYAPDVLPSLIIMGAGFGLIFAPAINTATYGVDPQDAGVASAMVNTMQQVGGSVGTALLSTLAAHATASYIADHGPGPVVASAGAIHGYTVAFWVSAGVFVVGAVICGSLLRPGRVVLTPVAPPAAASPGAPAAGGEPVVAPH
jgi:EmrB/QacA subfamily drug resistance transporter